MVTKLTILLVFIQLHWSSNTPLRQLEEAKSVPEVTLVIPHQTTPTHHVLLTPARVKKSPTIISIPISQILVPKLHVIPISQSNTHHSTIHTDIKHVLTNDNMKIPIISHTISHSTANITHPTPSIPIIIYPNVLPLNDLSVIPLQKTIHTVHKIHTNMGHYGFIDKKSDDVMGDSVNFFRSIYGGFGNGLHFGGHGAGHGYHVYG